MTPEIDAQGGYYRTIAREFFKLRGAPFFLSALDQALIADWERQRVPLDAVLEGLGLAFQALRARAGRRPRALSFCRVEVERSFRRHLERKVGGTRRPDVPAADKAVSARREVEDFLGRGPSGVEGLDERLREALAVLAGRGSDEDRLEAIDDAIDALLWERAPAEDRASAMRQVAGMGGGRSPDAREALARTHVVKAMRTRHRIPFVSLYYY